MKLLIGICLSLVLAVLLIGAEVAGELQIPLWTGKGYIWISPGPSLVVRDGKLDVLPAPVVTRVYGALVERGTDGKYTLPEGARGVVVFFNKLRMSRNDYRIENGALVFTFPPGGSDEVLIDYDVS